MNRGIKDEGFVRHAFDIAKNEDGRWIANQSCFNGNPDSVLQPVVHAALVTSVAIYVEKLKLEEVEISNVLQVKTVGQARALIDRLSDLISRNDAQT